MNTFLGYIYIFSTIAWDILTLKHYLKFRFNWESHVLSSNPRSGTELWGRWETALGVDKTSLTMATDSKGKTTSSTFPTMEPSSLATDSSQKSSK